MRVRNKGKSKSEHFEQASELLLASWQEMVRFAALTHQARNDELKEEGSILPYIVDRVWISKAAGEGFGAAARLTFDSTTVHRETWVREFMHVAVRHGTKKISTEDYECPPVTLLVEEVANTCEGYSRPYWHYFPVHLFREADFPSFDIGPVRFLRGAEIPRFVESHRGPQTPREDKDDDLRKLSEHDWVAAIEIQRSDTQRGHDRAKRVVKLAILGLAIQLADTDSPMRIRMIDEVMPVPISRRLAEREGRIFSETYKHPMGIGWEPWFAAKFLRECSEEINWLGVCLSAYVDKTGPHATIQERWLSALFWYGLGRDQLDDFAAVVDFGAALDTVLGDGDNRTSAIKEALAALFRMRGHDILVKYPQLTLDEVVDQIYGLEGRARFMGVFPLSQRTSPI